MALRVSLVAAIAAFDWQVERFAAFCPGARGCRQDSWDGKEWRGMGRIATPGQTLQICLANRTTSKAGLSRWASQRKVGLQTPSRRGFPRGAKRLPIRFLQQDPSGVPPQCSTRSFKMRLPSLTSAMGISI